MSREVKSVVTIKKHPKMEDHRVISVRHPDGSDVEAKVVHKDKILHLKEHLESKGHTVIEKSEDMSTVSLESAKALFDALAEDLNKNDKKMSAAISILNHPTDENLKTVKIKHIDKTREFHVHKDNVGSLKDYIRELGAHEKTLSKGEMLEALQKCYDEATVLDGGERVWINDVIRFQNSNVIRGELLKSLDPVAYNQVQEEIAKGLGSAAPKLKKEPMHPDLGHIQEGHGLRHEGTGHVYTVHSVGMKNTGDNKYQTHHELTLKTNPKENVDNKTMGHANFDKKPKYGKLSGEKLLAGLKSGKWTHVPTKRG